MKASSCVPKNTIASTLEMIDSTVIAPAQIPTVFRFSRTRRKPEKAASEAENFDMSGS